ncbi:MAG TPA: Ig-like domain-containing protein, partial [Gemmatimonadaceae bacterium]
MRRPLTWMLAALAFAACTDTPVVGRADMAPIALRPVFATGSLGAVVAVDHIHIVLTRPPSTTPVLDTTIVVQPGTDSVSLQLSVHVVGSQDQLTASIDLIGSGIVYYHGTANVVARAGQRNSGGSTIVVVYVGPGASASSVVIAPRDTTILANGALSFAATAFGTSGSAIANTPIAWSVSDASLGAITSNGQFTGAGRRGTITILAATPTGLADSVHVKLQPVATHLTVVSGDAQSAPAGGALAQPVVVEADGVDGAVAGVLVRFSASATGGGGHVQPDSAMTDANGRASTQIVLGTSSGTQQYTASSSGLTSVTVSATATAVATAIAKVSGDGQADSVGLALNPFVVKVTDAFGNAAPGATVTWIVVGGTGKLSASTSATDANGQASVTYTLSNTTRVDSVRASLGTTASVLFTASAFQRGAAKLIVLAGDGQTGTVGTT